ncbi:MULTISPECIES: RES family NAD+ phosphorylase [Flavobacteriaceae]|uniref:RES family NAD+ phosphorylase n=1 Tax=Polaribacter marinus TaxID=2916838 RepID=A0A9X1VKD0_9FLAO|nr:MULTISPECIES: RES family NAD+ phosphorylase [Flavobacteriaceae]MCI2227585.1 RES family NAD+ phosphorylase [Polaribacter marinus]MCT4699728.1 RES family NAD+ phosphorylase [Tenacibaculum haliotis]MDO6811871.1 RES family NAD+ phosphorylase [Tenacibaculum soleae]
MNCCVNCFTSDYIISIINADDRVGNCNFCKSTNVSIYTPRELIPFFRNFLSLYAVDASSNQDIAQSLKKDFNLTTDIVEDSKELFKAIFIDEMEDITELFNSNVSSEIKIELLSETNQIHGIWEDFKEEIKYTNRYHIQNTIDLKKLANFFEHESFYKEIKKGRIFYRCRISDKKGFAPDKMGNPPKEVTTGGRANPKGISYLYVADTLKTSLYETRASLFDYVTVGEFQLKEDLKILNLRNPKDDPIPWSENEAIEDFLIYVPFIQTLQKEISLPIRKLDKQLDYIPTQYISEFIKSLGFDGVEYQSSLYSEGYNLAIFNPEKLNCKTTQVYEIEGIDLHHKAAI